MSETCSGSPDLETAMNQAVQNIKDRYAWQFKCLLPYGLAVGPGWHEEIRSVFDFVDHLLTDPRDRAIFSWRQVKEKFGELRMHAQYRVPLELFCRDENDPDWQMLTNVVLPAFITPPYYKKTDDEIYLHLPDRVIREIEACINQAHKRCLEICEECGAPGSRVTLSGWHAVRCDLHGAPHRNRSGQ